MLCRGPTRSSEHRHDHARPYPFAACFSPCSACSPPCPCRPRMRSAAWPDGWSMPAGQVPAPAAGQCRPGGLPRSGLRPAGRGPAGAMILEMPRVWFRNEQSLAQVVSDDNEVVAAARAENRGILFLTPHLGCFEITARYLARLMPMTVMFRPPRRTSWRRCSRRRATVRRSTPCPRPCKACGNSCARCAVANRWACCPTRRPAWATASGRPSSDAWPTP